eukprot:s659_g2.t1
MLGRTCLLFVFQGSLQSWAMTQCEDDQATLVQTNPQVLKGGALEQEATGRASCNDNDFNKGDCSVQETCAACEIATGGVLIPPSENLAGFPPDSLTCGPFSCSLNPQTLDSDKFYVFKNPSDYLVCNANFACNHFNVRNMAGICCEGDNNACKSSEMQLHGDHSVGGDVCCSSTGPGDVCSVATLTGVRNIACFGRDTCRAANIALAGDLVVGGGGLANGAANAAKFTFTGGNHCIRVVSGTSSLQGTTLTFNQPSTVDMWCQDGSSSCPSTTIKLSQGSCFHVNCGSSGCANMVVEPADESETDPNFGCHCSGSNCGWTASNSYCSTTSTNPCTDSCPGTSPVCLADETSSTPVDCARLATSGGTVEGDPHLRTLDGRHYTLMQQGNFLLWGFSGYETEVLVKNAVKKVQLEFEIFAHYAGHASFTKGLLFVDKSRMPKQVPWRHWR